MIAGKTSTDPISRLVNADKSPLREGFDRVLRCSGFRMATDVFHP
jgi:hypothetical protein